MDRRAIDSMVLKFREVLKETERLGSDDLRTYQENLLRPLLLHARKHVPFYEKRLDVLFRGNEIDFSRWNDVPILTRAEAQKHFVALQAREVPPHLGAVTTSETSGSTGRPVRFLKNDLVDVASLAMNDRIYRWWGFDGNKTLANIMAGVATIAGDIDKPQAYAWHSGYPSGVYHQIGRWTDAEAQLDWLLQRRPDYLLANAVMLRPLAEAAEKRGANITFDRIISASSMLTSETRAACRQQFSSDVIDLYGISEFGFAAGQCDRCGEYHIGAESAFVEILDPDGEPTNPGQNGKVIASSLYNYAFPLIRYDLDDFATQSAALSNCAIRLPALNRLVGRYRNTFKLRDGRVLYPFVNLSELRNNLPCKQFQIVQRDYEDLLVKYVPDLSSTAVDVKALEAHVQEALDASFRLTIEVVESIDRSASGKFEDYLSLVTANR